MASRFISGTPRGASKAWTRTRPIRPTPFTRLSNAATALPSNRLPRGRLGHRLIPLRDALAHLVASSAATQFVAEPLVGKHAGGGREESQGRIAALRRNQQRP